MVPTVLHGKLVASDWAPIMLIPALRGTARRAQSLALLPPWSLRLTEVELLQAVRTRITRGVLVIPK